MSWTTSKIMITLHDQESVSNFYHDWYKNAKSEIEVQNTKIEQLNNRNWN